MKLMLFRDIIFDENFLLLKFVDGAIEKFLKHEVLFYPVKDSMYTLYYCIIVKKIASRWNGQRSILSIYFVDMK